MRADDRGREPAAGEADRSEELREPGRLRRRPARPRGGRREVQRRAGRRARRPGAGPGGGDRRPGDPGGKAARSRAAGRLSGCAPPTRTIRRPTQRPPLRRCRGGALLAGGRGAASRPGRRRTRSAPSSSKRRPSCSSKNAAGRAVERGRGAPRRPAAPRPARRTRPAELREVEAALRDAAARPRPSVDEVALAAARGQRRRGAAPRRACAVAVAAARARRRGRGAQLAADPRLPPDDPLHPARASTRPGARRAGEPARSARARRSSQIEKDLLDAFQARLPTNLDEAAQAARAGLRRPLRGDRRRSPAATGWRSRPSTATSAARPSGARPSRDFARLAAAGGRRRGAPGSSRPRKRVEADLEGFTAAPLTRDEQANRASQLTRFLDLVPKEYDKGTADGAGDDPLRDPGGGRLHGRRRSGVLRPRAGPARARPRRGATGSRPTSTQLRDDVDDAQQDVAVAPQEELDDAAERGRREDRADLARRSGAGPATKPTTNWSRSPSTRWKPRRRRPATRRPSRRGSPPTGSSSSARS